MKSALLSSSIIALATALAAPAMAQTAPAGAAQATGGEAATAEVIVTGTRQTGVKAVDSPAPIELVGSAALKRVGQPDLMQALSQSLPSFNAQQYGADTAALTLSAALRGLNPNQTLVLIDGKRRHGTANLQVDGGSPYQGAATTDLSFIPVDAIDHVEVLEEGAAAQYGSDAIAGVVNFILKKQDHGGSISGTAGEYYEGDGETAAWSLNKGFNILDKGFFNFTAEEKVHSFSRQGTFDRRFNNPDGSFKNAGPAAIDNTNVPLAHGYPKMNNIYGDPEYQIYNIMYNAGYNITPDIQLYSFGSFGHRTDSGFENYRRPSRVKGYEGCAGPGGTVIPGTSTANCGVVYPFPIGFSPREKFQEDDYSFTGGLKGTTMGFNWDISSTYGKDRDLVYTINSANAELFAALQSLQTTPITDPQRNFFDGTFEATEWTNNIDISRDFDTHFFYSPLNIALGGETRRNTFAIGAGEPNSYYGGTGAQSFSGYAPIDAGGHSRTSYAGYIDLATDIIKGLHVDMAGRYEHYSDFGDAKVGKITARYDFNDMIAVRGTVSTGFRAPTPQEEFYEGINVSPSFIQGQLPPNSAAAAIAGFKPLQPEVSHNYSVGFVLHPMPRMQISADFYEIDIHKRIVGSASLLGSQVVNCPDPAAPANCVANPNPALGQIGPTYNAIVSQAIVNALSSIGAVANGVSYTSIQLFTNGANTRTRGAEVTATYSSDFGDMGHVDWSAGFDYNKTTLQHVSALPAVDYNALPEFGQTALLLPTAIDALTTATPKYKVVLAAYWTKGKWAVNLREDIFGDVSQRESYNGAGTGAGLTNVKEGALAITDLDVSYKLTSQLRLNMGANNLFDQRPVSVPTVGGRPADGNNVFGEPIQFSPIGINGGYFYGRVTYSF